MEALVILIIAGLCVFFMIKKSTDKETTSRVKTLMKYMLILVGLLVLLIIMIVKK
jgi:hypothetical protein